MRNKIDVLALGTVAVTGIIGCFSAQSPILGLQAFFFMLLGFTIVIFVEDFSLHGDSNYVYRALARFRNTLLFACIFFMVIVLGVPRAWVLLPDYLTTQISQGFSGDSFEKLRKSSLLKLTELHAIGSGDEYVLVTKLANPAEPGLASNGSIACCDGWIISFAANDVFRQVFGSVESTVGVIGWTALGLLCLCVLLIYLFKAIGQQINSARTS